MNLYIKNPPPARQKKKRTLCVSRVNLNRYQPRPGGGGALASWMFEQTGCFLTPYTVSNLFLIYFREKKRPYKLASDVLEYCWHLIYASFVLLRWGKRYWDVKWSLIHVIFFFPLLQLFTKFSVFSSFIVIVCSLLNIVLEFKHELRFIAENVVDCLLVTSDSVMFERLLVNLDVLCWNAETLEGIDEMVERLDRGLKVMTLNLLLFLCSQRSEQTRLV